MGAPGVHVSAHVGRKIFWHFSNASIYSLLKLLFDLEQGQEYIAADEITAHSRHDIYAIRFGHPRLSSRIIQTDKIWDGRDVLHLLKDIELTNTNSPTDGLTWRYCQWNDTVCKVDWNDRLQQGLARNLFHDDESKLTKQNSLGYDWENKMGHL